MCLLGCLFLSFLVKFFITHGWVLKDTFLLVFSFILFLCKADVTLNDVKIKEGEDNVLEPFKRFVWLHYSFERQWKKCVYLKCCIPINVHKVFNFFFLLRYHIVLLTQKVAGSVLMTLFKSLKYREK